MSEPKGLKNLSNSCFFNSVVQNLLNSTTFTDVVKHTGNNQLLYNRLKDLIEAVEKRKEKILIPMSLRQALAMTNKQFADTNQHDANECFLAFISKERNDTADVLSAKQVYHGKILRHYTCRNKHVTKNEEEFCNIMVDITSDSLGENLQNYFERIGVKSDCEKCKEKDKNCSSTIIAFPEYLVITLKRFYHNTITYVKNNKEIRINRTLEFYTNKENYSYELVGTINHMGGLEGGHYTAHVNKKNQWYHCNDDGIFKQNDILDKQVYMAFYKILY
jgi:ubiquitin C-terminal hydrolase